MTEVAVACNVRNMSRLTTRFDKLVVWTTLSRLKEFPRWLDSCHCPTRSLRGLLSVYSTIIGPDPRSWSHRFGRSSDRRQVYTFVRRTCAKFTYGRYVKIRIQGFCDCRSRGPDCQAIPSISKSPSPYKLEYADRLGAARDRLVRKDSIVARVAQVGADSNVTLVHGRASILLLDSVSR